MKTYIDYIHSFWKKRTTVPLTSAEADLYLYLLNQCNLQRFCNPFPLSTEKIILALSIELRSFKKARTHLQELGYITFTVTQGRGKETTYTILEIAQEKGTKTSPFSTQEKGTDLHPFNDEKKGTKTHPFNQEKGTKKGYKNAPFTPIYNIEDIEDNNIIYTNSASDGIKIDSDFGPQELLVDVKDGILQAVIRQQHQSWIEIFCMNNQLSATAFGVNFDIWCKHIMDQGTTKITVTEAKKHFANWYKLQVRIQKQKQDGTSIRQSNNRIEQRRLQSEQRNQERAQRILSACGISDEGHTSPAVQISDSHSAHAGIPPETGKYPFD